MWLARLNSSSPTLSAQLHTLETCGPPFLRPVRQCKEESSDSTSLLGLFDQQCECSTVTVSPPSLSPSLQPPTRQTFFSLTLPSSHLTLSLVIQPASPVP